MKIEFLLAYEDQTWTTEIFEVPDSFDAPGISDTEIAYWWQTEGPGRDRCYRKVVMAVVYNINPEEE